MSLPVNQKYFDYRLELKQVFQERRGRNPRYSLRSYARDLDLGVATLSQVLSGKRHLSVKNAKKVVYKLCWGPFQEKCLYDLL